MRSRRSAPLISRNLRPEGDECGTWAWMCIATLRGRDLRARPSTIGRPSRDHARGAGALRLQPRQRRSGRVGIHRQRAGHRRHPAPPRRARQPDRKLAILTWHLLTKQQDYAHQRPRLMAGKVRRHELQTGAPTRHRHSAPRPNTDPKDLQNVRLAEARYTDHLQLAGTPAQGLTLMRRSDTGRPMRTCHIRRRLRAPAELGLGWALTALGRKHSRRSGRGGGTHRGRSRRSRGVSSRGSGGRDGAARGLIGRATG